MTIWTWGKGIDRLAGFGCGGQNPKAIIPFWGSFVFNFPRATSFWFFQQFGLWF
jgi:hypothetical protein